MAQRGHFDEREQNPEQYVTCAATGACVCVCVCVCSSCMCACLCCSSRTHTSKWHVFLQRNDMCVKLTQVRAQETASRHGRPQAINAYFFFRVTNQIPSPRLVCGWLARVGLLLLQFHTYTCRPKTPSAYCTWLLCRKTTFSWDSRAQQAPTLRATLARPLSSTTCKGCTIPAVRSSQESGLRESW